MITREIEYVEVIYVPKNLFLEFQVCTNRIECSVFSVELYNKMILENNAIA